MKNRDGNRLMQILGQALNVSQKGLEFVLVVLTVMMVILVFCQVIFRYVLFYPISWSEELATIVFVWLVLLGAAVGIRKQEHLGINLLVKYLPKRIGQILALMTNIFVILFFWVVLWYGWKVAISNMLRRAYTMDIPVGYIRMALPIMALFCILFGIEIEMKLIRNWLTKKSKVDMGPDPVGRMNDTKGS